MAISNILKDIRVERNLIQEDLAEATGSCSRTIGRIERGERNPSLEMAIRLAHYLNMSVEDIFKLDDGTSSQKKTED
ncbi:helix-turn-helix domain-containing protein [Holdemanella biformis]|uniref:helix-turn-helix transcriptional regulator n=1 Tax=Holdemanella biformis TaxID=1735 RepID=UPI001D1352B3|nr:helix-turn-helix transcriptional regulator [Holdemanella biformis]MCC3353899.1 helix-turn-helix domain-containing protein [Holdemanella biformis]